MPYARRIDANQKQIVNILRAGGCRVIITSSVGSMGGNLSGFPDLVVKAPDKLIYLVEVKNGKQKLTTAEQAFAENWDANGNMVVVIRSEEEAIEWMNEKRRIVTYR